MQPLFHPVSLYQTVVSQLYQIEFSRIFASWERKIMCEGAICLPAERKATVNCPIHADTSDCTVGTRKDFRDGQCNGDVILASTKERCEAKS